MHLFLLLPKSHGIFLTKHPAAQMLCTPYLCIHWILGWFPHLSYFSFFHVSSYIHSSFTPSMLFLFNISYLLCHTSNVQTSIYHFFTLMLYAIYVGTFEYDTIFILCLFIKISSLPLLFLATTCHTCVQIIYYIE